MRCRSKHSLAAGMDGGGEKAESEALGAVLMNGVGGRESPGMGVSGSKPLVNGELREVGGVGDDGSETDLLTLNSTVDGSSSATLEDVAVKVCVREKGRDVCW